MIKFGGSKILRLLTAKHRARKPPSKGNPYLKAGVEPFGFREVKQKAKTLAFYLLTVTYGLLPTVTQAQSIIPTADGTGTIVTSYGNRIDITGGKLSGDGANLFHSFTQFDLNSNQIANFLSTPAIRNILGRVNGGSISFINGLIQVSGSNANLFLINPAGIVFGPNASLNVPASFTAATATGIGFASGWFNANGPNNYAALVGTPNTFAFTTLQPGAIINEGNLSVGQGRNLSLVGGTILSTGTLSASGGQVIATSVPGESLVRLSQPGQLLSLEIQPTSNNSTQPSTWTLPVISLPQLLTGGSGSNATGMVVNPNGSVQLTGSGISVANGDVVAKNVTAQTATLSASHNLTLVESNINTIGSTNPTSGNSSSTAGSFNNTRDNRLETASSLAQENKFINQKMPANFFAASNRLRATVPDQVLTLEQTFTGEYEGYLKHPLDKKLTTLPEVSDRLQELQNTLGVRTAVIYVSFKPAPVTLNNRNQAASEQPSKNTFEDRTASNQLELLLVTPDGKLIQRSMPEATPAKVLAVAQEFKAEVTNPLKITTHSYLPSAKKLYQWLVAPLEGDLAAQHINNLVFIMDKGLRALPIAALHDGQGFLVERYSVALMPSFSLTDPRYHNLKTTTVLAMGAAQFADQMPLPAVPVELSEITPVLWLGKSFLNDAFTLANLKEQRRIQPFGIVHLATHTEFQAGDPSHSYIQLWDTKLRLNQLGQMNWNNPPVNLLVLSGCRTALGDEQAELGFAGIAVQAGVESALASLWYVSDEGTLALMTEFYEHLKTAPFRAEALRQAQLEMIKGQVRMEAGQLHTSGSNVPLPPTLVQLTARELQHPYYWAAFTLIGNPW